MFGAMGYYGTRTNLEKNLLEQFVHRRAVKLLVKAEEWPRPFQMVPRQLQLIHGVHCVQHIR